MSRSERIGAGRGPGRHPGKGLVAGLIGGMAGSLAMATLQGITARIAGGGPGEALDSVAGDVAADDRSAARTVDRPGVHFPSNVRAAGAIARLSTGRDLTRGREAVAGRAFHFAFGTALGGAYGLLVEYAPWASMGAGLPFGTAQVLLADEWMVPALGLAEPPGRSPATAHLRSLLAHAGYGFAAEVVRRAVRTRL